MGTKQLFGQTTDAAEKHLGDKHKVRRADVRTEQPLIVALEQFLCEDLIAHFLCRRRVLDYKAHQSLVRTHQM